MNHKVILLFIFIGVWIIPMFILQLWANSLNEIRQTPHLFKKYQVEFAHKLQKFLQHQTWGTLIFYWPLLALIYFGLSFCLQVINNRNNP